MALSAETLLEIEQFPRWEGAFMVPIEFLVGPEWNVNEMAPAMFNALVEEIKDNEFDSPLQIVPIPGEKMFLVIGGDHRLEALKVLKWTSVPCCLKSKLDPDDIDELKAYSVRRNNLHGDPNPEKLAVLEDYLAKRWKKSGSAIRRRLLLRSQKIRAKVNGVKKDNQVSGEESPPSSGKDTTEDHGSGVKNKPFVPPKKKDPEEAKEAAKKAVTLADKHKLQANIRSLAKIMVANCEDADTLKQGFAYFGHGGKCHLVVEMTPELTAEVKNMVKRLKADKGAINEFLAATLKKALEELPKKSSKKKKAQPPKTTNKNTSASVA